MTKKVAIIGAGPAGFAAAEELTSSKDLEIKVDIFEKGREIDKRKCPREVSGTCVDCFPCNVHCGIGGAGLMSDGKLIFSTRVGNNLNEILKEEENQKLVDSAREIFTKYGALFQTKYEDKINELRTRALQNGIDFVYSIQAHIGSDRLPEQMRNFQADLIAKGVNFFSKKEIKNLNELSEYDSIILAPGRSGSKWLEATLNEQKIEFGYRPVDIGVRVEVPKEITASITDVTRDMKFYVRSKTFNDLVRTFCVCPAGFVSQETHEDFNLVNGYSDSEKGSENTNFAVLTTVPLDDSNTNNFAAKMAELGYILRNGRKITAQRLGDLKRGRKSKDSDDNKYFLKKTLRAAEWGDISLAFVARHYINIMEGLEAFNRVIPGLTNDSTILYAPEMKFHGLRIKTNEYLRAKERIYVAGDGAGMSRGIVGAAASGIRAAQGILRDFGY
jgi:uncharacterized FAD-dependent dehydrogenase